MASREKTTRHRPATNVPRIVRAIELISDGSVGEPSPLSDGLLLLPLLLLLLSVFAPIAMVVNLFSFFVFTFYTQDAGRRMVWYQVPVLYHSIKIIVWYGTPCMYVRHIIARARKK